MQMQAETREESISAMKIFLGMRREEGFCRCRAGGFDHHIMAQYKWMVWGEEGGRRKGRVRADLISNTLVTCRGTSDSEGIGLFLSRYGCSS